MCVLQKGPVLPNNQLSLRIMQTQCNIKNIIQRNKDWHVLALQKTLSRFFCTYTLKRGGKKKKKKGSALGNFCLARFSSKSYSLFNLLPIYCKTIACYARIVICYRTKNSPTQSTNAVVHTYLGLNCFHFDERTEYSWE